MLMSKKNVVVYTIQIDTEIVAKIVSLNHLPELFKKEFVEAGMEKEAQRMEKGGFSFRETESNSYYTEYEISIVTRNKVI